MLIEENKVDLRSRLKQSVRCGVEPPSGYHAGSPAAAADRVSGFAVLRGTIPSKSNRLTIPPGVHAGVRRRVLRAFVGRDLIESLDAKEMLAYEHNGFSVDASVCIEARDRSGLERLLRYCARPPFAMDRLRQQGAALVYRCAKQHSEPIAAVGARPAELVLTPLELIDVSPHWYHTAHSPSAWAAVVGELRRAEGWRSANLAGPESDGGGGQGVEPWVGAVRVRTWPLRAPL